MQCDKHVTIDNNNVMIARHELCDNRRYLHDRLCVTMDNIHVIDSM